ncbi:MAG: MFS transporter [Deltaproteobacteria bacterium]|nr:MFS transporter [Deltaproteobacteria bacterium]
MAPETPRSFGALTSRNFRLLWSGSLLSQTGDFIQMVAQYWLVLELTNSPLWLGVIGFCQAAPRLVLGLWGGVLVDRHDRRRLLLWTQLIAMLQALAFGLLISTGLITLGLVVLLVLILGVVNTVHQTTRLALIPALVEPPALMSAIALNSTAFNVTRIAGPTIGGLLVGWLGVAGCMYVNAVSFLAILVSVILMDLPPWQPGKGRGMFAEVREGLLYAWRERVVVRVLAVTALVAFFGLPYTRFLPVVARDILQIGAEGYGLLMAMPGVGAVAMSLVLAYRGEVRGRETWLIASAAGFGGALLAFSFARVLGLALFFLVAVGAMQITVRTVGNTLLQEIVPEALRGRIMSLFMLDTGLWSLGSLAVGGIGQAFGIPAALALSSLGCLVGSLALAPGLLRLHRPAEAR